MEYKNILIEKDKSGIFKIILNQPGKLNVLSTMMSGELICALREAGNDENIKVIIITGSGKAFSGGGDIRKMEKGLNVLEGRNYVRLVSKISKIIYNMDKPVIASVNGYAMGAGCNLVLAADFIIASTNAKFGQSFLTVGLVPDVGGTYFLTRLIGLVKAKEWIFTGKMIDAWEAEKIGLVTKVVEPEDLENRVKKLALNLAQGPSVAIGLTKLLLNKNLDQTFDQAQEDEIFAQSICMQTDDHKEGVKAFLEKRKPEFNGK